MHELQVTQSILDTVLAAARENGLRSVCTINLVIGELRELRQEWIQHYFDYLSAGSAAEGARLLVRTVPAAFGCEDCRCEFPAAIDPAQAAPGGAWDTTRCPECQGTRLSLVRGREFLIQDIEGQ